MKIRSALIPFALTGLLMAGCAATPEESTSAETAQTESGTTEGSSDGTSAGTTGSTGEAAKDSGTSDSKEETGGIADTTKTYAYEGVTVSMPVDWTVVDYGGQKAIAPSSDILSTGYVALDSQTSADLSGDPSIDSEEAMEALVQNMIRTQNLNISVSQTSISRDGAGLWKAVLPIDEEDNGGNRYKGEQLIAADGGTVWLVTGLCPESDYDAQWNSFQAIINSATFSPTSSGSAA